LTGERSTSAPEPLTQLTRRLVKQGEAALARPLGPVVFADDPAADALVNDIQGCPQAFVLACLCDRRGTAEQAWKVPHLLQQRIGTLDVGQLARLSEADWLRVVRNPTAIHVIPETMARVMRLAVERIATAYGGDASRIWTGTPPSARVVRRFLEFHGAGPKIATMAANILVRHFHVPLADYHFVDISVDRHVRRVMARMGFVEANAEDILVIYAAREAHPDFPGIFDLALWDLGRRICRPANPRCDICPHADLCAYAKTQSAPAAASAAE
jgi:endonuclease III